MEVPKPKGRQGAKKKAPAAAAPADVKADDDEMLDLAQRLAKSNFGSTTENPSSKFSDRKKPQN